MGSQNSIQKSSGYWVTRLSRSMEKDFEKRLEPLGITRGSYAVLIVIHEENKTKPSEIAGFLGVDGAAVTRHLDRIEKQGLIERTPCPTDRRSTDIKLTASGKRTVRRGRAASMATNEKFTADLTAKEVRHLQDMIQTMLTKSDISISDF